MSDTISLNGKRILVVDDEPDILGVLEDLLDMCEVVKAGSFEEGKKQLESQDLDIAILDIMGVNGYGLLKIAKSRKIPAIMLTAHAFTPDNLFRTIKEGADSYIPKEEISHIAEFLTDVLKARAEGRNPWEPWQKKLPSSYFENRWGAAWRDTDKDFWERFKASLKSRQSSSSKGGRKMTENLNKVKVAVVQASPILFDHEATVEKVCRLTKEAAAQDVKLILFPEAFIPAYPRGLTFGTVVGRRSSEGRRIFQRYWDNSIDVPGPDTEILAKAARDANVYLAIGVIERNSQTSKGTLFCTLLYFGPDGQLLGLHRKLKPTGGERLIWGEGDGSTLTVINTEFGKVGGLICWENYMPLARTAMYNKGVELYLAPTADARDTWQATLRHIACEGRCFVLGCNQFVTKEMYPADLEALDELDSLPDIICRGGSAIISPLGKVLAGPLWDKEDMLIADLNLSLIARSKFDFDVVGHYARPDVFQLMVNENPQLSVINK